MPSHRSRRRKKKSRFSATGWPGKIIRWRYRGETRRHPMLRDAPPPTHAGRTSATRGDETILCIKQKAPQYDIPRVSYLRFVHISSASPAPEIREAPYRNSPDCSLCDVYYNARAIFLFLYIRVYIIHVYWWMRALL